VSPYLQIRLINIDEARQNLDFGREDLALRRDRNVRFEGPATLRAGTIDEWRDETLCAWRDRPGSLKPGNNCTRYSRYRRDAPARLEKPHRVSNRSACVRRARRAAGRFSQAQSGNPAGRSTSNGLSMSSASSATDL
jgi:hypothetical protein